MTVCRIRSLGLFLLTLTLVSPLSVYADSLDMPSDIGAGNNSSMEIDKPTRGMTMDDVTLKYGEPSEKLPAVGDPPITRWVYPNFTVHFERQYVIYAVVPHKHAQ